MRLRFKR